MSQKIKFLFHMLVFQSVLNLRFKNGKIINSPILTFVNLLVPVVTFFTGYSDLFSGNFRENMSAAVSQSKISSFLSFVYIFTFISQPLAMAAFCFMMYKKRHLMKKTVQICYKVASSSAISKFDHTVKICFNIYLILQLFIVIQWITTYVTYYNVSLITFFNMTMSAWNAFLNYYMILLGLFFIKFIVKLFDGLSSFKKIEEVENQLKLINNLLVIFNEAFGLQLSFVLVLVIYFIIANVSIF